MAIVKMSGRKHTRTHAPARRECNRWSSHVQSLCLILYSIVAYTNPNVPACVCVCMCPRKHACVLVSEKAWERRSCGMGVRADLMIAQNVVYANLRDIALIVWANDILLGTTCDPADDSQLSFSEWSVPSSRIVVDLIS